jgi:hypothetical protein
MSKGSEIALGAVLLIGFVVLAAARLIVWPLEAVYRAMQGGE